MKIKNIQPKKGVSINSTAYLISRSISKKGIKANPFLREIKIGLKDRIEEIKSAVNKDLNTTNKAIITKIKSIKGNKYIQFKK